MSPALVGRILTTGSPGKSLYQLVFFKFHLFYSFLAVLGLCGRAGFSVVALSRGYFLVVRQGLLTAAASLFVELRF